MLRFLIGQVMGRTGGAADPKIVSWLLRDRLARPQRVTSWRGGPHALSVRAAPANVPGAPRQPSRQRLTVLRNFGSILPAPWTSGGSFSGRM